MKRIIVEGMDSTGKSTLIQALSNEFHFLKPVVNELGPEQDFDTWWPAQLMERWANTIIPIHDRFFYSELIYGTVLRGYVKASGPVIRQVEKELRDEAFLIYCRPPTDVILNQLEMKSQMDGVVSNKMKLLKMYDQTMTTEQSYYGHRYTSYNYTGEDFRLIVARTERYLLGEPT